MASETVRLTQLSHKGGCGCKIAPAVLQSIINQSPTLVPKELLVGLDTSDDAAVYKINEDQAIVATTDFFMPIVDDAFDFGRIAATNAISDVYAMGGQPLFALAIVGMPISKLSPEIIRKILQGGEAVCSQAGIPIAGGHSIDSNEPIYGLVVIGLVHPKNVKKNTDARAGDAIILGKPLGVGLYASAVKKGAIDEKSYQEMISMMTQLNTPGRDLALSEHVHALTDVTGFGLAGHLLEICRGSKVGAKIFFDRLPLLPKAIEFAENGFITGASTTNWQSYSAEIIQRDSLTPLQRTVLTDPQTSGGLLVTCSESAVGEILQIFQRHGLTGTVIGEIQAAEAKLEVL